MINFCIGTFLKLPASGGFPQTGFVLYLSFLLPNIFFGENGFMVVLRNFSECNGLKFYIPEISQNSCYHKIS